MFHFGGANINSIVLLIPKSSCSLLLKRKAIDFCVLTLYLQTSYNCLLVSKIFFVDSLGLPIENKDHGNWSHHFMGNSWGNSGNSVRLYFWGSKITADGDHSHEIKRCLLLGRKVMTNLDSILNSRDITLPTKACLVKAMVFPVVMYGCESWTVKES